MLQYVAMQPQILVVANYVRDEDGKVPNLAQLGTTWQLLPAMPGIAIGTLAP